MQIPVVLCQPWALGQQHSCLGYFSKVGGRKVSSSQPMAALTQFRQHWPEEPDGADPDTHPAPIASPV